MTRAGAPGCFGDSSRREEIYANGFLRHVLVLRHLVKSTWTSALAVGAALLVGEGCGTYGTPLAGSIGTPNSGRLTHGATIAPCESVRWLRENERHWGLPRFTRALARAAARVADERPHSVLAIGDISAPKGGPISGHLSHRSGVDADLLLYLTTLDGAPVESPGFIHVGADGLAFDRAHNRYLRFDVERQWLLIKALLEDTGARVQWIFASEVLEALLLEWARARGEDPDLVWRAQTVLIQPSRGEVHDDHIHVRTACDASEVAAGCLVIGPERPWLAAPSRGSNAIETAIDASETRDLVRSLFLPIAEPVTAAR